MESPRFHSDDEHHANNRDGTSSDPLPGKIAGNQAKQAAQTPRFVQKSGDRLNLLLSYAGWKNESWADHLPQLLGPLGVRSLIARTGHEASEVITSHPIHIAVVDLGLPLGMPHGCSCDEEAGSRMLDLLARLKEPPPTVVITRGKSNRQDCREMNAALRSGAYAVIGRPDNLHDLERLLEVLRRCLVRHYQGRWPGGDSPRFCS